MSPVSSHLTLILSLALTTPFTYAAENTIKDYHPIVRSNCRNNTAFVNYLNDLKEKADVGDVNAQKTLGLVCLRGDGVIMDEKKSFHYFLMAAKQGDSGSQMHIADCYEKGIGTEKNLKASFEHYTSALSTGNKEIQFRVANMYYKGQGTPVNIPEALKYFELSADQGHLSSAFNLGVLYFFGQNGVQQDIIKGFHYLKYASDHGHVRARETFNKHCEKVIVRR